jgi:hypothetical protein
MAKKAVQPVTNPGPGASVFLDAVAPKINARWCEWTVVGFGIWRGACGAADVLSASPGGTNAHGIAMWLGVVLADRIAQALRAARDARARHGERTKDAAQDLTQDELAARIRAAIDANKQESRTWLK